MREVHPYISNKVFLRVAESIDTRCPWLKTHINCDSCPKLNWCWKWWNGVSCKSSLKNLSQEDEERVIGKFVKTVEKFQLPLLLKERD